MENIGAAILVIIVVGLIIKEVGIGITICAVIGFVLLCFLIEYISDSAKNKNTEKIIKKHYDKTLEDTTAIIFDIYDLKRQKDSKSVIIECSGVLSSHHPEVTGISYYCYRFFVDSPVVWNNSRFTANAKGIISNGKRMMFGYDNHYSADMIRIDDSTGFIEIR